MEISDNAISNSSLSAGMWIHPEVGHAVEIIFYVFVGLFILVGLTAFIADVVRSR
jgi:hypothetical protein